MRFSSAARVGALLAGSLLPVVASAALTVTPVTWNVIGLDSNTPSTGPRYFPVGERVCTTTATGPVTVTLAWDSANANINLRAGTLNPIVLPAMAAGACADAYFEVDVNPVAASFDTRRRFHVTATEGANSATSPTPRELYVEHLISQSRNGITAVKLNGASIPAGGTMALVVGGTYTIELDSFTATQGYNQFESFINFSNTVFQILSVQSQYSSNNSPFVANPSDRFYADSCGWDPNPASPNYNACIGGDYKTGGTVTTIYTVRIVGGGGSSQTLNTLLYDFSGSSFHYNADFGVGARIATIVDPASLNFSKAFSPSTVPPGGTANLVFTIANPNAGALGALSFNDTLPSSSGVPMTIAGAPTSSGCGAPSFTAVVGSSNFSFGNGSVASNASCVVTLPVKIAASPTSGTYHNVSGNLFANGTDTGKSAVADLTIGSSTTGTGVCGLTMASWDFAGYTANPPLPTVKAANVSTAAIVAGASITIQPDASVGNPIPSLAGYGWPNAAANANNYIEFQLDTSQYTAVNLTFDYRRKSPGPNTIQLYYLNSGNVWTQLGSNIATSTSFASSGARDFTGLTSTTGTTFFRIYGFGANNTNQGSDLNVDNIVFTGCSTPVAPTLAKAFAPSSVAVGGTSVLTFTLTNPNSVALTGATFTDALPAGTQVGVSPAPTNACAGTLTAVAGSGSVSLSGGSIPASGSCTITVPVTATTPGPHTNVSGYVSTTQSGTNATSTGSGVASLTALSPPSIQKSFGAASIAVNGQTTLTFVLTNPNADVALAGVAFGDTYPANMTNAGAATSNTCGGTLTANAGANAVTLSGGGIAAGGNCSIVVPVTVSAAGNYVNTSGNVSATTAGTGNNASASLAVTAPNPAISLLKQVATSPSGPWLKFVAADPATTQLYFRFVAENVGDVAFNPFSVSDPQLAGTGADPATCAWQTDNLPSTLPALPVGTPTVSPVATCVKGPLPLTAGPHTNTATASGTFGGNPYASDPSSTDWFGVAPGFSLTKQVSVSPSGPWTSNIVVAAGTNVYYRFALVNTGNVALTSVGVTDPTVSTLSCTFIDPLPIGGATSCVVGPVVAAGAPGSSTVNTATGHGTDSGVVQTTAPSSATYTITSLVANLAITKTNGVSNLVAGTPVTYTIVASNAGPDAAVAVQVVDTLPASLTAASWTCAGVGGGTCTASGTGDINDVVNLPAGASVTYTLSATVSASATSPLSNTATVTPPAGVNDPDPSNNTATDSDPIAQSADLAITKTNGVASVGVGGTVTYTIVASNAGPSHATGATVADTLPATLLTPTWTCVGAGGGTCTGSGIGNVNDTVNLPAGGSVTYTVTATLSGAASGTLSNTATVAPPAGVTDPNPANNSATDSDPVTLSADVSMVKTLVTTGPFFALQPVQYTLLVGNAGPSTATSVQVTDTPANLTITNVSGGGCAALPCTIASLSAGASVTITVTATINAAGAFDNAAGAFAAEPDPNPANNTDNTGNGGAAVASADLAVTKTNGVTSVTPGTAVTYTITASNAGPSSVAGATVSDTLPVSLIGASWTCVGAGGGTCTAFGSGNIGDTVNLPVGGSATYTVSGTLSASATGTLTNTVTVNPPAGVTDPNLANNTATDSDPIAAAVSLGASKTDGSSTYTPGGNATYTIVVTNGGPSDATNVTVTDLLPPGVTLSAPATCAPAGAATCGAVTGAIGGASAGTTGATIPAGAANSLTFMVPVAFAPSMNASPLVNTASVLDVATGATASASDSDTRSPNVTIAVAKTDGSATYTPGGTATYQITVTNGGVTDALDVNVADALPPGVTLTGTVTCAPTGIATCGTVSGTAGGTTLGTVNAVIPAGGISSIVLSAPVAFAAGLVTDPLVNTAVATDAASGATGNGIDSDARSASVTLALTKTDGVAFYTPGGTATYTVTVANTGATLAGNVTVADTLPAGVTLTAPAGCVASGTATCGTVSGAAGGTSFSATGATLPPGAGNLLTITLPVRFAAGLVADPLINTVTATDASSGASGSASDSDNRSADAGLVVTKTDGVAAYTPGGTTTYTIVVSNGGPSDATSVAVADPLPAGLALTGAATCVPAGAASCGTVTGAAGQTSFSASGASIAAGAGNTLTFTVPVSIGAGVNANPLVNTVTVTSPDALAPATASDSNTLAGSADLAITKTDGVTSVSPGGAIAYTVVASNAGPSSAPGASVSDTMPASLTGVTWTCVGAGGGACTASGSGSIADTVNLPVGGTVTYTVNATVSLAASGTLTNAASVAAPAGVTDPNPGNNTATDVDTVVPLPPPSADLAITKSNGVSSVTAGGVVTYTIVATNLGPSAVTGATVSDAVPASLTGATWTCVASAGSSCPASGSGSIAATVNLLAAGTATFTLTGTLSASASGTLSNTATVAVPAGVVDPNPGNNSATDSDPISAAPPPVDLSITITNVGPFSRGQTGAQYAVTVANVGGVPTSGPVTVTVALPAGVTPAAIAGSGWTCTQPVGPCTITTTLGPGGSYPVITMTVNVAANAPSTLVAIATVAGGGDANGANNTSQNAVTLAPAGQVVEVPVNSPLALVLTLMLVAMAGASRLARRRAR
jgi:uncharacterized repeat protein (TIGR01451 family)